jgi:hypothetical protein
MKDKNLWNQPAPASPGQGAKGGTAVMEAPALEEEVATISRQLEDRGWCLLRCGGVFGGDTIVLTANKLITGYPEGYPVYSTGEIAALLPLDDRLLQAAHRAKKELGAQIEGAEKTTAGATKPAEEGQCG